MDGQLWTKTNSNDSSPSPPPYSDMHFSMRPPFLCLIVFSSAAFVNGRSQGNRRTQELTFVHTFDTRESCMSRCRMTCTQHHSEDLMMPRWQCPQQEDDGSSVDEEEDSSLAGNLVFIVPTAIVCGLIFLFCVISCLQRFCRNDDL